MKYFIFENNRMRICKNFEEFIKYFAYGNYTSYGGKKKYNDKFNEVAMNENDVTYAKGLFNREYEYRKRSIMVVDEYDRTIDPRHYEKQILNYEIKYIPYRRDVKFEFRRGPVPGIHRRRWNRGVYYRHPKTTQEIRMSCDNEIKDFIKPSRNISNLPNVWDEISRNRDHSWKAKKIKKQWMKHI